MKKVLLLLLLAPVLTNAQSPFDGTWLIDPHSFQLSKEPIKFLLEKGWLHCVGCVGNVSMQADGVERKIAESSYWNSATVRVADEHTIEITTKKNGKVFYAETDTVSADGEELIQILRDTTEAETVTIETRLRRIKKGPPGAHIVSGSWRAYKVDKSQNGLIIKYRCTADGFSAETPLGEKYEAKFDGRFVLTEDDPGQTRVAVKRIDDRTVETIMKRGEEIVGASRLSVSADGQTLHAVYYGKNGKTTGSLVMKKQN
jgi:hypothetical protein